MWCNLRRRFETSLRDGELIEVGGKLFGRVVGRRPDIQLLWELQVIDSGLEVFAAFGDPIRYSYVPRAVPLDYYQAVYSSVPGSAESPSAGRPFSWELLGALKRDGVGVADLVLHTGLSSFQDDDFDLTHRLFEEWFSVGESTAARVNAAKRVVAVGTTVVRALESAVVGGEARATEGWATLQLGPGSRTVAADALLTGLHEPQASHFDLLSAFMPRRLLERAYDEAIDQRYLWHEFGDSMLII